MKGRHLVKVRLVPWDDRRFREAYEQGVIAARTSGLDLDAAPTAYRVESELRQSGYDRAAVRWSRSVDEALDHVAHWEVLRDGVTGGGFEVE